MIQWQTAQDHNIGRRPRCARDPSGVHVDGVKVQSETPPATIAGVVAINQGSNGIVIAHHIVPRFSATAPATTVADYAITPPAHGVSIDGTFLTLGAAAVAISITQSLSIHQIISIWEGLLTPVLRRALPCQRHYSTKQLQYRS